MSREFITAAEAWEAVQKGYYVTTGGYTYGKDVYFADGPFPSCIRGGDINRNSFAGKTWRLIATWEDLILSHGYFPGYINAFVGPDSPYYNDFCKYLPDMHVFITDSQHTAEDFKCFFKNERIWTEFFYPKDEDELP